MSVSESNTKTAIIPESSSSFILRLLNGPLKGCEFTLLHGITLFVVSNKPLIAPEELLQDNIIYIPMDNDGVNFEIHVVSPDIIYCHQIHESETRKETVSLGTVIDVGQVKLAIKKVSDEWTPLLIDEYSKTEKGKYTPKSRSIIFIMLVIFITILATAYLKNIFQSQDDKNTKLSLLLGDTGKNYFISKGIDNVNYIIAPNERLSSWAKQSLIRLKSNKKYIVSTHSEEAERISNWLGQNHNNLKYHKVLFGNPSTPVLVISKERNQLDDDSLEEIIKNLKVQIPYAKEIIIDYASDLYIENIAEQGLKKLSIPYVKKKNKESISFTLPGELNDSQILRLKSLSHHHRQLWGGYVHFVIDLKDSDLKGKSLSFGEQNYIKLNLDNWVFSEFVM